MIPIIRVLVLASALYGACSGAASMIAPGTFLIAGEAKPNRQPDGNTIVIAAPAGLIVFDTGRHPEHAQQVIDFARAQDRPIAAIINSHWHLDHVGGNPPLRAAFPNIRVYASSAIDDARSGFLTEYRAHLVTELAKSDISPDAKQAMRSEMALIDAGAALGPTDVIEKSARTTIAGRALQVHLESNAVTAGDIWVFDPKTHVLLAGDLITLPAPFREEPVRVARAGARRAHAPGAIRRLSQGFFRFARLCRRRRKAKRLRRRLDQRRLDTHQFRRCKLCASSHRLLLGKLPAQSERTCTRLLRPLMSAVTPTLSEDYIAAQFSPIPHRW
jgi:glyoxylase-like metal-dependent hydrolase (beta-lactamase superfamily II)